MEPIFIGAVTSVNVGQPRVVEWFGRSVTTAIWKSPSTGPVTVGPENLDGDRQADLRVHGGPDKAVYAYAEEDLAWWSAELGIDLGPGTFGDNLTTVGVALSDAVIGEQWSVGSARFEVSQPRQPCFKLGIRMGDAGFVDRFDQALRFGSYLRVVEQGTVTAGDEIRLVHRPDDDLRIIDLARAAADHDPATLSRIAANRAVPEGWRAYAERQLLRRSSTD